VLRTQALLAPLFLTACAGPLTACSGVDLFGRPDSGFSASQIAYSAAPLDPLPQFWARRLDDGGVAAQARDSWDDAGLARIASCAQADAWQARGEIRDDETLWDLDNTRLPQHVIP
jgi:hypothetical protein